MGLGVRAGCVGSALAFRDEVEVIILASLCKNSPGCPNIRQGADRGDGCVLGKRTVRVLSLLIFPSTSCEEANGSVYL